MIYPSAQFGKRADHCENVLAILRRLVLNILRTHPDRASLRRIPYSSSLDREVGAWRRVRGRGELDRP